MNTYPQQLYSTPPSPPSNSMPAIAVFAYIFSFLFSPLGLVLSIMTLSQHSDRPRAKTLAYVSIFIGLCYLGLTVLIRIFFWKR